MKKGVKRMSFVITSACIHEQAGICVDVCPVDCIVFGDDQFLLDPNRCIDCGACETVCPVEAIYFEEEVPAKESASILKAKEYFGVA